MKHTTTILLTAILATGCMSDEMLRKTTFTPYITKDGEHKFRFLAANELPSYYPDGTSLEATHTQWVGVDMALHKFCEKGYNLRKIGEPTEFHVTYEGECKK